MDILSRGAEGEFVALPLQGSSSNRSDLPCSNVFKIG